MRSWTMYWTAVVWDPAGVIATQWLAIVYVPLVPIRRAQCAYVGESLGNGIDYGGFELLVLAGISHLGLELRLGYAAEPQVLQF